MSGNGRWADLRDRKRGMDAAALALYITPMSRPRLAAALLLTAPPTDRALTGWQPNLPVSRDERVLRAECREAASFT